MVTSSAAGQLDCAFLLFVFLDAFLACPGSLLGLFRTLWDLSWVSLGPSWDLLGLSWAALGPFLAYLEPLLDSLGLLFGLPFRLSPNGCPNSAPRQSLGEVRGGGY